MYMLCIICIIGIIECLFSCNVIRLCFCYGMHEDTSSFRVFSDDSSGRQIIRNFSFRQRLHLLFELLYGELDERMRHEMKKLMLLSLRVQMYFYAVNKKGVSCRKRGVSRTKIAFLFKCSSFSCLLLHLVQKAKFLCSNNVRAILRSLFCFVFCTGEHAQKPKFGEFQ